MPKKVYCVIALAVPFFTAIVIGLYPVVFPESVATPSLDMDVAKRKVRLDSRVTIELAGYFSEDTIKASLKFFPSVAAKEVDLVVEHIAKLPWHESFPWSKTRVVINPKKAVIFRPDTEYQIKFQEKQLTVFETIVLPKVVDVYTDSPFSRNFEGVATSNKFVFVFNEQIVWEDKYLGVEPETKVVTSAQSSSGGKTQLVVAPVERWENSTTYVLSINRGVVDIFGHLGVEVYSLKFTTRPTPRVLEATPFGAHLSIDQTIRLKFERSVDRRTVEEAFEVEPRVEGGFTWSSDWEVEWAPSSLSYSTTYTVSVSGKAIGGDPIVPYQWWFTTQDPPIFLKIEGGVENPTVLVAVAHGGTGQYTYQWNTGETEAQIWVDLWFEEVATFAVTVTSGDQSATESITVNGPASPCPGWQVIVAEVCYREEALPGPIRVFTARIDLTNPDIQLNSMPASEYLGQSATVKEAAAANNSLVSVNGDYFDLERRSYFTHGPIVSDGNFVYWPPSTRAIFVIGSNLESWVGDSRDLNIFAASPNEQARLGAINSLGGEDSLVLYNAYWGKELSLGLDGCYAIYDPAKSTQAYRFFCGTINNLPINLGEFVLIGRGKSADWLRSNFTAPINIAALLAVPEVKFIVGGSHILIQNDQLPELDAVERHPRTAIGIDEDGFLYLVVADGRSKLSIGMTLLELGQYLASLGATNALNLDGGGSSTMVLQMSIVNHPSDGKERSVASVVGVTRTKQFCWHRFIRC